MTTYEQILWEGKLELQNVVIINAYRKDLEIALIAELTGLTTEEVLKRIRELGLEEKMRGYLKS